MRISLSGFLSDFSASIVVYLVALPLCLGVALASETPPIAGLIAGIVGGIVIGLISKSQLSVSGPAAGLTAIVAGAIVSLPSYEALLLSFFIAGLFQIFFGFLKAGRIANYIPFPVIKGMLAAIGLILIFKQVPYFFGLANQYHKEKVIQGIQDKNFYDDLIYAIKNPDTGAVLIGIISLLILLVFEFKKFRRNPIFRFLPAPLLAVIAGICLNIYFKKMNSDWTLSGGQLVLIPVFESSKSFFESLGSPDFQAWIHWQTWSVAIVIAIIASLETLLSIEAIDKLDPQKRITPQNHELKAQGIGNVVSALVGGLPVTSVIVRSSANVYAGAVSKFSTIFHGLFLMFSLLFIPSVLNLIPLSSLAAMLIVTGYKLIQPKLFVEMKKKGWDQLIPFLITIVAILQTDLLEGVFIGILTVLVFFMFRQLNSAVRVMKDDHRMVIKFGREVSFLNRIRVKKILSSVKQNSLLYIDATNTEYIDQEIVELVNAFLLKARETGIEVYIRKSDLTRRQYFKESVLKVV
jgi:MFS superfamily sulfate permease-like transporter